MMTLTLANCSLTEEVQIDCDLCHFDAHETQARILTADTHAFNDFEHPEDVTIQPWTAQVENGKLQVKLPPCSVVAVAVK